MEDLEYGLPRIHLLGRSCISGLTSSGRRLGSDAVPFRTGLGWLAPSVATWRRPFLSRRVEAVRYPLVVDKLALHVAVARVADTHVVAAAAVERIEVVAVIGPEEVALAPTLVVLAGPAVE